MKLNENYKNLEQSYLFSNIAKKVAKYKENNQKSDIIRLGIGDVTLPLPKTSIDAMQKAVAEMSSSETFRGYGEEQGYSFLRESISKHYLLKSVSIDVDEIFISDGAKSDLGNILDIFDKDNIVMIPNPVYPVYVDTNVMAGREIILIDGNEENNFLPMPDHSVHADIIYLCSPNNPTGAVYSREQLKIWVDYALKENAVILFDSAYEAFITDKSLPTSIYQIEGATRCAIEFCSFSKTAGFTGIRCGYTVVPKALVSGENSLNSLWLRRQTTKFNGVSYIVQCGANAIFSEVGRSEVMANIKYYLDNAQIIMEAFAKQNISFTGGTNSPYIWLRCPQGISSWEYFDLLLTEYNIVGTPGSGFGTAGEGYFRLTAFGDRENIIKATNRLKK